MAERLIKYDGWEQSVNHGVWALIYKLFWGELQACLLFYLEASLSSHKWRCVSWQPSKLESTAAKQCSVSLCLDECIGVMVVEKFPLEEALILLHVSAFGNVHIQDANKFSFT